MLVRFEHTNGANPYIATSNKKMFEMFCNYYTTQLNSNCFVVNGLKQWNGKRTRQGYKELVRAIALDWQGDFSQHHYSYCDIADWVNFFEEYGKKYGLLKEFRKNGII